jgi:hypothetical protein
MTGNSVLKAVPRTVVGTSLRALRLPLSAVERVAGQQEKQDWPPAMAYEALEANVETVLGGLLRDETLVERGRLRQAKLDQLRKATELATVAEQERQRAERELEQRQQQAERQREQAERTAQQREQQAKREAEQRERKAQQAAARKAAAAREVKERQDEALARQERAAKLEALGKESQALSASKKALDAEETVQVIDETLEGTKEARKSS